MRNSIRSIKFIALFAILAGLLFSPAEGICLLPFPQGTSDVETRDVSLGNDAIGYQKSLRRIAAGEKNSDSASQSIKKSTLFLIGNGLITEISRTRNLPDHVTDNLFAIAFARLQLSPVTLYSRPPPSS
ncbi:MAG TPA: hypothetical protein VJ781_12965 [Pyrinomonadaceae bacterium]|nr:hypothetical protein [Pyrinomonadaceae bacterium]